MATAVIIMGSKSDLEWSKKIREYLSWFGIEVHLRVASAHKTPELCLSIIQQYNKTDDVVFITVAGRSNALSGFVDAQTHHPVLACPPYSDKFAGADIFSTLRMPSAVAPAVVLEPEAVAIVAAKIFAMKNPEIKEKVRLYQQQMKEKIIASDKEVSDGKC